MKTTKNKSTKQITESDGEKLKELFVDGLKDIYWAEKHLAKALVKMSKAATSEELKSAFETHTTETEGHVSRLEEVFGMIDEKAQELGRLIGQSAEYQALRRAEKTLQEDPGTRGRLEKIEQLARIIDEQVTQKKMPDEATMGDYESAVRDLETSPEGQGYVVARANYEKVMQRVNQQMSAGIERGAASSIITLA